MKTVEEIYQSLLETFAQRAGYAAEDSCDLAVRLYAAAAELQALSIQADWVLDQSFPQTAEGVYLDYHAAARGLSRMPAVKARGVLRFSVDSAGSADRTIEAGTVCMTPGETRFQTTQSGVLAAGALWVDIPAEAVEAGASGNAAAGAVTVLTACPVGVTACTNPAAFTGGCDAETDGALRERVLDSYRRLPNGANAAWYEETAMSHDGVAAARAVGRARGTGTVDVYIAAPGGVPEDGLLEEVRADLQQRREIAVDVAVKAPEVRTVDVAVELAVDGGAAFSDVKERVETAVTGYFTGGRLGKGVLLAELGRRVFDAEGVANYHILSPAADVPPSVTVLPVLGALTVTEMEG